ncbi:MAG: response regulator [Spirochaetales bacterium]|nr:response regulator [Spirochaetales bacterium]
MVFLVAEGAPNIRDSLCYALLSLGIKGLPVASRQEALSALQENEDVAGAIVDIDSREIDGAELIQELRANEATQGLRIIVHTVQSSKEMVVRMMEYGVVGYLLKPYKQETAFGQLKKILARSASHNSQRKHIRVRPDPEELLRLHFRLQESAPLVSGKVVDISVGGVAVELFNPPPPEALAAGTRIPNIQFTLMRQSFKPPGRVVLFKEKLLALRFEYLTAAEKSALSKYVFKRLTT